MKRILLNILLPLLVLNTNANDYIFSRISVEKGLSCTQVQTIIQDRKGFIWVGTSDGLNRFDGFSFKNFLPIPGNPKSIQANNITNLYEDSSGNIWIIFMSGEISVYNPFMNEFLNFSSLTLKKYSKKFSKVTTVCDINDTVFIGSDAGLIFYDKKTKTLINSDKNNSAGSYASIKSIYKADSKHIWISTGKGLVRYDTQNQKFTDYKLPSSTSSVINYSFIDSSGTLWVCTQNSLLFLRNPLKSNRNTDFRIIPVNGGRVYNITERIKNELWVIHDKGINVINSSGNQPVISANYFNSPAYYSPSGDFVCPYILHDENHNLWFGDLKSDNGLYFFSAQTGTIERLVKEPDNPLALAQYNITTMFIDQNNNLWIGHDNSGLSMCGLSKSPFNLKLQKQIGQSLSSNHILSLFEDTNRDLWIGTSDGIDIIDNTTGKLKKNYRFGTNGRNNQLSGRIVSAIEKDKSNNMWIGYIGANPDMINLATGKVTSFRFNSKIMNSANIWATMDIHIDNENTVWLSTRGSGLAKYNNDGQTFTYYTPGKIEANFTPVYSENNHISDFQLYCLCEDKNNNLWIGTELGGLSCLNKKTMKFTNYMHTDDNSSISSNLVRVVYCDSKGTIWVGTNIGLNKFDKKTASFKRYTTKEGLVGNTVQGIIEASEGILFISTNSGISRFDTGKEIFTNYSTRNGLLSNEYSTGACIKRKSGELVFGSVNKGLLSFFPEKLNDALPKAEVLISQIKIRNKELEVGEFDILEKDILYSNKIEIPYKNSKDISIQFIALNYRFPESIIYRYMLKGHDQDWKVVDFSNRNAFYNQLNSGNYEFMVSSSTDGVNWSEPKVLEITILTPWWNSWWFYLLTISFIAVTVYLLYRRRIESFKNQQIILEQKVTDRTARLNEAKSDLENKNEELKGMNRLLETQNVEIQSISAELKKLNEVKTEFFTNISHELRTPLTIIKGLSESVVGKLDKKEEKKIGEELTVIQKNTLLLIRQVNQLLNISLLDKGKLQPKISPADLKQFLKDIINTFNTLADIYKVKLSYHIADNIGNAYFDKDIVEHILFNLLSNAFKYTPNNGSIIFVAFLNEKDGQNYLSFSVEDNGIGIKQDELESIFDRFYQNKRKEFQRFESSGIGLAYCKEIVNLHLGTIICESEYGKGSKFSVSIPVSKTAFPDEWVIEGIQVTNKNSDIIKELAFSNVSTNSVESFVDNKPTILIAEDNNDLMTYLFNLLSDFYKVEMAANGKEGLEKAAECEPDVILSDIMMPVMSGLELCKHIKENESLAHTPVILLTARSDQKQQLEGYDYGADDYITKPFDSDILLKKINSLINQKERLLFYFNSIFTIESPGKELPDEERIFLEKATKVVMDNLQNPAFDVDMFCSELYMSRTNLFRKLKQTTGLSATGFTNSIRVKQAANLLRKKIHTVNEVSYMVGFVDPSYFSRCFKKAYNVSPGNFV